VEYPAPRGSLFSSTPGVWSAPKTTPPSSLLLLSANERYPHPVPAAGIRPMSTAVCAVCGGPQEAGFIATSNGSGLFWTLEASQSRFRPKGLEVLVGTGFGGTYSANLPGLRCAKCNSILVNLPARK